MATKAASTDSAVSTPARGPKGSGTSLTIDLKEYPELLADIRAKAKADDREPSKYLRRIIVELNKQGKLFG